MSQGEGMLRNMPNSLCAVKFDPHRLWNNVGGIHIRSCTFFWECLIGGAFKVSLQLI